MYLCCGSAWVLPELVTEAVFILTRLNRHHQRKTMGSWHTEVPSPGVAAFMGFAAQAKPVQFESAGAFTLHTPSLFGLNPDYVMARTQGIRV